MGDDAPESEWTIERWKEERDALVTENERLIAILAEIPWDDLGVLLMGTAGIDGLYDFRKVVVDWANANRPKEPVE